MNIQHSSKKNNVQEFCINVNKILIQRTVFEHWKTYVLHKLRSRQSVCKANAFYRWKLQKKILNKLLTNCAKNVEAVIYFHKVLLKRYFENWLRNVTYRRARTKLTKMAEELFVSRCLGKHINCWRQYVLKVKRRKEKREKVAKARKHYEENLLRKTLTSWKINSGCVYMRIKTKEVDELYKSKLLYKYLHMWIIYCNMNMHKSNMKKQAQQCSNKILLKRYLRFFIEHVKDIKHEKEEFSKAKIFFESKLQQKCYNGWQKWYYRRLQNAIKIETVQKTFDNRIKHDVFVNWMLYVHSKKCRRRKIFLSLNLYKKKLMSNSLKKLRDYVVYKKQKRIDLSCLSVRTSSITEELQKEYINEWKTALYRVMQEKRKMATAVELWELSLRRKYLFRWKLYSEQYKVKASRKKELKELSSNFLIKTILLSWRAKCQEILKIREKETVLISAYRCKIMRKYWTYWKEYISKKLRKQAEIEDAKELHKKFLLREGLKEILKSTLQSVDRHHGIQLETAIHRSIKNVETLKEFFDKWHSVVYLKKVLQRSHGKEFNKNVRFMNPEILPNNLHGIENTKLVLPEYMREKCIATSFADIFVNFPESQFVSKQYNCDCEYVEKKLVFN